jgi:Fusaric acid resistance protein-like
MHMQVSSSDPRWRAVVAPADRFHWLLGARVALAFVGPVALAHITGRWERDAPLVAIAAMLVAVVGGGLPAGRARRRYGPAVVVAVPAAAVLTSAVPAHSVGGVVILLVAALIAGLAPLRSPAAGAVAGAFALSLIVLAHMPSGAHTAALLLGGGGFAMVLVVATDALRHPRLGLPSLPSPAIAVVEPHERRRHAVRLVVTIAIAAGVAAIAGDSSTFAAHSSWMLLGVWIALQPHAAATRHVALQRGAGTALGALLTLVLAVALPHGLWLGWLFLALAFLAFGLRTVNYAWYCVLLTPIVVLGFTAAPLDVQVLLARVAWTAGGVELAVLARHLLWHREPAVAAAPVLAGGA